MAFRRHFPFSTIYYQTCLGCCSFDQPIPHIYIKSEVKLTTRSIPLEVLQFIAFHSDQDILVQLMTVSKDCFEAAGPVLYEKVRITKENAVKVFMGMARTPAFLRYHLKREHYGIQKPIRMEGDLRHDLTWTRAILESEDEIEPDPTTSESFLKLTYSVDYPSEKSHRRKRRLLSKIQHLIIGSIPSKFLIDDMQNWLIPKGKKRLPINSNLFRKVKSLCFESKAILDLYNWHDRHGDFEIQLIHPLIFALNKQSLEPNHICITYPKITEKDYKEYHQIRFDPLLGTFEEQEKNVRPLDLRFKFKRYIEGIDILVHKLQKFNLDSAQDGKNNIRNFTIHNCSTGSIPHISPRIRVFFSGCQCPKIFQKKNCFQHVAPSRRKRVLMTFSHYVSDTPKNTKHDNKKLEQGWEIISEEPSQMNGSKLGIRTSWEKAENEVVLAHPNCISEKVQITDWEDAKPCECCGKK